MTSVIFSMHGRKCLITGASLSVGRAIALGFAEHGADIIVHSAAEADKETVTQIRAMGRNAHAIEADLAVPGGPKRAFDWAVAALGQIHQHLVLFNHIDIDLPAVFLEHIPHLRKHIVHSVSVEGGV